MSGLTSLYESLSENNLVVPYVGNALMTENWPDHFTIPIRQHDGVRDDYFHPSSHAVSSARVLYYQMHPEHRQNLIRRPVTVPDVLSPLLGTIFHVIVQEKLRLQGWIAEDDIEVPLVNEEVHGRGHMDLIFPHHPLTGNPLPIDIKTASPANFDRMMRASASYEAQLQLYMDWLPFPVEEGVIFVIEMGRPFRMKEFRVTRDEALLAEIYQRWAYVRECVENNTPPEEKCCAMNSATMKKCPAREMCLLTYADAA